MREYLGNCSETLLTGIGGACFRHLKLALQRVNRDDLHFIAPA
ncbi:hypothetical protein [Rhizobium leguminosarum]|nr:hypothetical protein [Rhizobium leguminosarum]